METWPDGTYNLKFWLQNWAVYLSVSVDFSKIFLRSHVCNTKSKTFFQKKCRLYWILYFLHAGQCQVVNQYPEISWSNVSKSAEMNCSHNKDAGHNQMYWYKQRPGESMTLIVYMVFDGQPDYGRAPQNKYVAIKDDIKTGALTVNDLQLEDSGVYFCAVSKHSDVRSMSSWTKTASQ